MDLPALAAQIVDEEPYRPMGFVVSITRGGSCRRLHFTGGCWRIPGEHFRRFVDYGQQVPSDEQFTHRCKDCFPAGRPVAVAEEAEIVASASSGSSSSASSGASAAASASREN